MKTFLKLIVFIICTSILMFGVWFMTKDPVVDPTLESLLQIDSIRKNTKDVLNETGVNSADDITYKVEEKKVVFHYGKHKFSVNKDDIRSSDFVDRFKKLNLEVNMTKDGKVTVKYDGTRVKEVV